MEDRDLLLEAGLGVGDPLVETRVLDGDRDGRGEGVEELEVAVRERAAPAIHDLEDPDDPLLGAERRTDQVAGLHARLAVHLGVEPLILAGIGDPERPALPEHPPGDPERGVEADRLEPILDAGGV